MQPYLANDAWTVRKNFRAAVQDLKGGLGKPLTVEHLGPWDSDQLVHIILDGIPGTPMPPWRPLLSELDARWIADRLKQGNLP